MMTWRGWRWKVQSLTIRADMAMRAVAVDRDVAMAAMGKCRAAQDRQYGDAERQRRKEFFHRASRIDNASPQGYRRSVN